MTRILLLHRGVADYDGVDWRGTPYPTAEALFADMAEDQPGYGVWWTDEPSMAAFYGGAGVVVSAWFAATAVVEPDDASGLVVARGTVGTVERVTAGVAGRRVELPHTPGLTVTT